MTERLDTKGFTRLVKLVARAFYDDDVNSRGANKPKTDKSDNRGIAVVVLDALTRREWVKEDDLAKSLRLHPKQLRRTLRILEEEALIVREHRRETVKGVKAYNAAIAATKGERGQREGEDKPKAHTHSYCCIDYAQVYDIVRYKIHRAKKKIKDELEDRNTLQHYICTNSNCGRRYSALDVIRLVNPFDENFHCEICSTELVAASDKLAAEELGDGEDNARRRRREKLKDLYERLERQIKPLMDHLAKVKDLTPPDYGGLVAWEARAIAAGRMTASGEPVINLPKASHSQGNTGTPMPFVGETKVEVSLAGGEAKLEDSKDAAGGPMKVLPPWMIREGMNLTAEQRGDVKREAYHEENKPFANTSHADRKVDCKMTEDDKEAMHSKLQEEYARAYYAALMQRQQEATSGYAQSQQLAMESSGDQTVETRVVGAKVKREEQDVEEEDMEWEDTSRMDGENSSQHGKDKHDQGDGDQQEGDNNDVDDDDEDDIAWE